MDKLNQYRQIIQKILTDFQQWAAEANQPGVEQCLAFDEERDHYFWFHVGWDGKHREFSVTKKMGYKPRPSRATLISTALEALEPHRFASCQSVRKMF